MNIINGRGYSYAIQYCFVWCVKHRNRILSGEIKKYLRKLLNKIAEDNGFQITTCDIQEDYVRLLIYCSPQQYIPDMMKALKGVSARLLMKEYGDALRLKLYKNHLWDASYLVVTVLDDISNTDGYVQTYLQNQIRKRGGIHDNERV